ncbi:MAG: hypothetical protein FGM24_09260 [Candidatus Kapabacteria bacterium]|nr:hypothetical protein [Candidatus Kapabacteria bacterium]
MTSPLLAAIAACILGAGGEYTEPETLAYPHVDYLQKGDSLYGYDFNQAVTDLMLHNGKLWMGYGDATKNMGSSMPIEFRYYSVSGTDTTMSSAEVIANGQGAAQRSPFDSGEEQIDAYRLIDGTLWVAGIDSNNPDEEWTQAKKSNPKLIEGNVFRLESDGRWTKFRSIPGGEHVHDVAGFDGDIYAVGSGANDRAEWEKGIVHRYLWRSTDNGKTFKTVFRAPTPDTGKSDTRFRRLLAVGKTLYAFGYVNPMKVKLPQKAAHIAWRNDEAAPVTSAMLGDLASLIVTRTWNLDADRGIVIARDTNTTAPTRAFVVDEKGAVELKGWAKMRVVDMAPGNTKGEYYVLAGSGGTNENFDVYRVNAASLDAPAHVLDARNIRMESIACWNGDLYLGTTDGQLLRSFHTK